MRSPRPALADAIGFVAVAAVLTALKASLFPVDRAYEADEVVFRTLADRLGEHRYDLLGSYILTRLDPHVYQRPLFHHPPLFAWALHLTGKTMAVPFLSNLLTLALVWWIGARLLDVSRARVAAVLYALCPVAFLCASRQWTDGLMTLWVTAAVAAMVWALDRPADGWLALPGTFLGLACLTKMPAVVAMAPLIALWIRARRPFRPLAVAAFALPVFVLVTPWLATVWHYYGSLGLAESRIPDSSIPPGSFLDTARHRPFWFYFGGLLMVAPVHVLSYAGTARTRWDVATWPWAFIVAFTVYGVGNTFQTRFIAPAMPGLCLMASNLIGTRRALLVLALVLGAYGLLCGWFVGVENRALGDLVPYGWTVPGLF